MTGDALSSGTLVARERAMSRLVAVYIGTGLLFMLVPGTFLGVVNLIQISGRADPALVDPAWLQAHGHAQLFGWIGSFMLGIGFYSLPAARGHLREGWTCWALWSAGVALRWAGQVWLPGGLWRVALPVSAALELTAFLLFLRALGGHHRRDGAGRPAPWVLVVMAGTAGWVAVLLLNLGLTVAAAMRGASPAIGTAINQHFLTLMAWGVVAPFIWGFSARWLPVLLGLQPLRPLVLGAAVAAVAAGITLAFLGFALAAAWCLLAAAVSAAWGLRLFEPTAAQPKTRGAHPRLPAFVRLAYVWLLIAAMLGIAAAQADLSGGLGGASRHAFTVGFTAAMVFAIGQRMLPAFMGHHVLWSPTLMGISLTLLMIGCGIRVPAEIVAYQADAAWAWRALPVSAVVELTAVTAFALNLVQSVRGGAAPSPDTTGA
ncbi:MAG: hypothetical protein AB7O67_04980 [Vicinamibacterales bacterium]